MIFTLCQKFDTLVIQLASCSLPAHYPLSRYQTEILLIKWFVKVAKQNVSIQFLSKEVKMQEEKD